MFQRQLIFLEVVTSIVHPVNKLYSLAYKVQQTFFVPERKKKKRISEQHDTSFLLTKYYSYWNVFYLVKMRNLSLVSIWSLRSLWSLRKKSKKGSAIAAIIRKPLSSNRSDRIEIVLSQRSLSLRSLESGFHKDRYDRCDRWTFFFFSVIAAITAIVVITWKPGFK